jgi:hypothetical protein
MQPPQPDGTKVEWWSTVGRTGFIGHWQDGEIVTDRQMSWLESRGGVPPCVASGRSRSKLSSALDSGSAYLFVQFLEWAGNG